VKVQEVLSPSPQEGRSGEASIKGARKRNIRVAGDGHSTLGAAKRTYRTETRCDNAKRENGNNGKGTVFNGKRFRVGVKTTQKGVSMEKDFCLSQNEWGPGTRRLA